MILGLLKFFTNKDNYYKYKKYFNAEVFPKEVQEVFNIIKQQHAADKPIDSFRDLATTYALTHPTSEWISLVRSVCHALETTSEEVSGETLQIFIDRKYASEIADKAGSISEDYTGKMSELFDVMEEYKTQSHHLAKELITAPEQSFLEDLIDEATSTGYKFRLPCLNDLLGKISSEFIIVAARPDGGKTTLLAQESWYIAKQLPENKIVLWFNNEEALKNIRKRVIQSALSVTKEYIMENPLLALSKYNRMVGENKIVFVDDAHDMSVIDKAIEKHDPGLIVIDQLFKVGFSRSSSEIDAEKFRQKCAYAREIAKHVCPVLASNQLDAQAEGVPYPSMDLLYGSKTGAQGESDALVFIGRASIETQKRYIYTPKNKLTGKTDKHEVTLYPEIARYEMV